MPTEQQRAKLQVAVVFECPNCGAENFIRPRVRSCSTDEAEEIIRESLGLGEFDAVPEGEVEFNSIPENVSCEACSNAFEADATELMDALGAVPFDGDEDDGDFGDDNDDEDDED